MACSQNFTMETQKYCLLKYKIVIKSNLVDFSRNSIAKYILHILISQAVNDIKMCHSCEVFSIYLHLTPVSWI